MIKPAPPAVIRGIADFFEAHTGQVLGESRMWRVETVLGDLMRDHALPSLSDLLATLHRHPDGAAAAGTIHALMNHESSFFRDINVFRTIEEQLLPALHNAGGERSLRIWCIGCSTGQEAYSVAMMIRRREDLWHDWRVSILGTDVSPFAVEKARRGIYRHIDVQRGLPVADLLRFFTPLKDEWQVSDELRSVVMFHPDNVLQPRVPTGYYDLILCRNVLMYFTPEMRSHALRQIARHSRRDTLLLLGAGETTIGAGTVFAPSGDVRGTYQLLTGPEMTPVRRAAG